MSQRSVSSVPSDNSSDVTPAQVEELSTILYDALSTYQQTHPEMSYGLILRTLDFMAYSLRVQMTTGEPTDASSLARLVPAPRDSTDTWK